MRSILGLLFLLSGHAVFCQSTGQPTTTNAVIVLPVQNPVVVSNTFYRQVNLQPANAANWLDYYKWIMQTKELNTTAKEQLQSQTIQASTKYIGGSWQFSLMNFIYSGKRNKTFLDAALGNASDKAVIYPYAIQYALIMQDDSLLKEYATALNELNPLSPALYEYHYNALMSAGENATIYAKGLSDLAPMAVLQQVYGIRNDIRLKYYSQTITDTVNAYICLSAGKEIIQSYSNAAYAGLLIRISGTQASPELQHSMSRFNLTQLNRLQGLDVEEQAIYKNYLPSFILLYRYFKTNNDPAAAKWKSMLNKIGRLTGNSDSINKMTGE